MATTQHNIKFTKMQGAGNDYIYVNTLLYSVPDPSRTAVEWSKPHFGIGSDGLILIGAATEPGADYSMRIFNSDGSEAMMCGNGTRCVAKYLHDKGMTDKNPIRLQTLSGIKVLDLHLGCDGKVESVTVDMGRPRMQVAEQFAQSGAAADACRLTAGGREFCGTFVSMGNPHFVIFLDEDVESFDVARYGAELERDSAFPQRCNIEFAQCLPDGAIRMRVWERGSGITLACGTGACATAVAARMTGRSGSDSVIIMDGGRLEISWPGGDSHVMMTGPAAVSFEGEAQLP